MGLKDAGMDALSDLTHLKGRRPGDKDLESLDHRRVSLHAINRGQFHALSGDEQAIYILRIAA